MRKRKHDTVGQRALPFQSDTVEIEDKTAGDTMRGDPGGGDPLTSLNWLVRPNAGGGNGNGNGGGGCLPMPTNPTPPSSPRSPPHKQQLQQPHARANVDYKADSVKPPHSYAQLITMAMQAHGGEKVVLIDIYQWITENFAFFRNGDNSWQNSIRHNLSLNKQFIKVPREPDDKGKGSYWMLDPRNKDPYCIRRRNFIETHARRQRPQVSRPMVNPAIKSLMEKTRRMQEARRHPFCGGENPEENAGGAEYVFSLDHAHNPPHHIMQHQPLPSHQQPAAGPFDDAYSAAKLFKRDPLVDTSSFAGYMQQQHLQQQQQADEGHHQLLSAASHQQQSLMTTMPIGYATTGAPSSTSAASSCALLMMGAAGSVGGSGGGMMVPPVVVNPHGGGGLMSPNGDDGVGGPLAADGERVKVEFNWEGYEYHPSCVTGVQLPLQLSPSSFHPFPFTTSSNTIQLDGSVGSVGLSPPNSEDCSDVQQTAGFDLRIPTPDWWRNQVTTASLMSPQTGFHNPLARVFENLHSSGSSCASLTTAGGGGGVAKHEQQHPWQESFSSSTSSTNVAVVETPAEVGVDSQPTVVSFSDDAMTAAASTTAVTAGGGDGDEMELFSLEPMQLPTVAAPSAAVGVDDQGGDDGGIDVMTMGGVKRELQSSPPVGRTI